MAKQLSDGQIGELYRLNVDFMRRVIEGDMPFENAMEILRRANRGHGYIGNQIAEGDDILLAIDAMERIKAPESEIIRTVNAMALVGNRFGRIPKKYRVLVTLRIHQSGQDATRRYCTGEYFDYLPYSTRPGLAFTYSYLLEDNVASITFPSTTSGVPGLIRDYIIKILTASNELVSSSLLLYTSDGRVIRL